MATPNDFTPTISLHQTLAQTQSKYFIKMFISSIPRSSYSLSHAASIHCRGKKKYQKSQTHNTFILKKTKTAKCRVISISTEARRGAHPGQQTDGEQDASEADQPEQGAPGPLQHRPYVNHLHKVAGQQTELGAGRTHLQRNTGHRGAREGWSRDQLLTLGAG